MRAAQYVGNIRDTVKSTWEGLSVTLSYMFRRPMTVQYAGPDAAAKSKEPPVVHTLPSRYRGFLEVDLAICTGCLACERACPIDVIKIEIGKDPANPKTRVMTRFDIDEGKCMFCGLCVEPCPTGSIVHTREFEGTQRSLANLVLRFIDPLKPAPLFRPPKGATSYPRAPLGSITRPLLKAWDSPAPIFPPAKEGKSAEPAQEPKE